jgi:hypothetical protein
MYVVEAVYGFSWHRVDPRRRLWVDTALWLLNQRRKEGTGQIVPRFSTIKPWILSSFSLRFRDDKTIAVTVPSVKPLKKKPDLCSYPSGSTRKVGQVIQEGMLSWSTDWAYFTLLRMIRALTRASHPHDIRIPLRWWLKVRYPVATHL